MTTKVTGANFANNVSIPGNYFVIPNGPYSSRPSSAANGTIRLNTSNNYIEYYNDGWYRFTSNVA